MKKQVRFLTIISILLFSTSVAIFANDISETVQEEQRIEQEKRVDFKFNYNEYSIAEKEFFGKYHVNPRNIADVMFKHKSFIRTGIGLAVGGGLMYTVGAPILAGIGGGLLFVVPIASIVMFILSGLVTLAGVAVQALCSVPFSKAGTLAVKYKRLYNIKLKDAVREASILSMHDSENKEVRMAMSFGIK